MNRELTKREKTLLLVLVVLVLVLGYCKLFLEPIDRQITSFRTNTDIEQAELDTDRVRLAQLEQMLYRGRRLTYVVIRKARFPVREARLSYVVPFFLRLAAAVHCTATAANVSISADCRN